MSHCRQDDKFYTITSQQKDIFIKKKSTSAGDLKKA